MKILQLDHNHPLISAQLSARGFVVEEDHTSCYDEVLSKIKNYEGVILRSRIPIDARFLDQASHLKFIARVGAGMENIDVAKAETLGIALINSPEGNRDAVAEQVLGSLLVLMNRLFIASEEVKRGIWKREENRGDELLGKTVGLIGYGHMGKATAKRLSGFGVRVIFHDILSGLSDAYATQVPLEVLQAEADVVSLHVPLTEKTHYMVDEAFIAKMRKPFYLVNTARGKNVKTKDLVKAIEAGQIKGAALDVLEFEKSSFEHLEAGQEELHYLLQSDKVLVTPHIAGWTHQSKEKLAQVIVDKILDRFSGV
ncbi:2-hydroxyacid dehydrogenase [Bergeyella sp. RCAD1439]|uniref:2-hydroxyacid dehydrogenase n=1 Tax=Bergeyella anatis TaxID=3113737 RepID=UPI002E172CEB|nr:2-hydroxyacid dehydrogenase [Bergeyella sp. RCAD1439]